ncbi:MAG: outer membrane beta-barrel protein [Gemmatimonadaceae bacterium]|nr:outer membrane beta-barrel protein [Gemmatimonadaceae bacterium]MDQ3517624.1 acyloxyacyl hydrolase [Gemmatimonadota bacterium]
MRTVVRSALAGLVLGIATPAAGAQSFQAGKFTVTPVFGTIRWDDASALANKQANESGVFTDNKITLTYGLTADYQIRQQFGVGFYLEAARPETRGDYFPSLLLTFPASAELRVVSQRVTVLMYGIQGSVGHDFGRIRPYISGGGGAVTVNADPQQSDRNASFTHPQFQIGGGLGFRIGSRTALRLDLRDYVFTDWDRDQLYPVNRDFQNTLFPAANGNPPPEKDTVHNFRIALGFSFVPRASTEGNEPDESPEE